MNNKILLSLIIILSFSQCKRVEEPQDIGHAYFPLEVGKYRCYVMDSIVYKGFSDQGDTLHYLIRETIESEFYDNENDLSYRVLTEYRDDSTVAWEFGRYHSVKHNELGAWRTRNDVRFVELSFPVVERITWNENEYNNLGTQENRYIDVDRSFDLDGTTYEHTISVDKGDHIDPYFHEYGLAVYARGIGLILEEHINTETQQGNIEGNAYTKKLYETNW